MSTATETEQQGHHEPPPEAETHGWEIERAPGEHAHPPHREYVKIAAILAVLTALEISLVEIDIGPAFIPALMVLMAIKFALVVLFFMHLRYDAKLFGRIFWAGVAGAVAVYVVMLSTFQFWG